MQHEVEEEGDVDISPKGVIDPVFFNLIYKYKYQFSYSCMQNRLPSVRALRSFISPS
jgi:hypothetical protein